MPTRHPRGQTYGSRQQTEPMARQATQEGQQPGPMGMDPETLERQMPRRTAALSQPSERPDEPFTAGEPIGPGPGPEAVSQPDRRPRANPNYERLHEYLPAIEFRASQEDSSYSLRSLAFRIRSSLPPDFSWIPNVPEHSQEDF